jgi:hypothetical protein
MERLLVENDTFRTLCEDLALARAMLVKLESFQSKRETAKIAEYHQLAAELENEISEVLRCAKQLR